METIVAWGIIAFVLSAGLTAACKPLAIRVGAVARPRADRWHGQVIPMLGGVAIALATTLSTLASPASAPAVWVLLGGAGVLFLVGLVDDVAAVRPQTKLVAQLVVASAMVACGLRFSLTGLPVVDTLLTLVWIVGITNAFNLLDNMDGLAAGIAAIAAAFRTGFVVLDGDLQAATIAAILLGATLGFLAHNRPPATIFMGDAGSMFIGCFVAGLSLTGGEPYSRGSLSILLIPVLLLLVPIFDTTFVTVTRVLSGRAVSVGGRDHTSHRLVASGLSEGRALAVLYGLAVCGGVVATLSYQFGLPSSAVLIVLLALATAVLAAHLARVRVHPEPTAAEIAASPMARLLVDRPFKRQVLMVGLDGTLIVVAYWTAYLLRFEGGIAKEQPLFAASLPIILAIQLSALFASHTYSGIWRYTGLSDLVRLVQAATAGVIGSIVALVIAFRFAGYSRAVFALDWLLLAGLLCTSRASLRLLAELLHVDGRAARRVLVYGAGDAGELALRKIHGQQAQERTVVGFLDDDPRKHGSRIQGVAVLGGIDACRRILTQHRIEEVLVASAKIPSERLTTLTTVCAALGVETSRATLRFEPLEGPAPRRDEVVGTRKPGGAERGADGGRGPIAAVVQLAPRAGSRARKY